MCIQSKFFNIFNSFTSRESEFFWKKWIKNIQGVVLRNENRIRIRRPQNTSDQVRILSTFRKTKFQFGSVLEVGTFKVGTSWE